MRRVTNNLLGILNAKWMPRYNWHDPVVWRRRDHNRRADHIANVTMNRAASWIQESPWPFIGKSISDCNLVIHSDGGARSTSASAAWIVEAGIFSGIAYEFKLLAMGGTYIDESTSSFTAECLALDAATTYVNALIR